MSTKKDFWVDLLLGAEAPDSVDQLTEEDRAMAEALGALGELARPVNPPADLRKRLFSTVCSARYRFAPFMGRVSALFEVQETRAETLLSQLSDPEAWRDSPWQDVQLLPVGVEGGVNRLFAKVKVNTTFPLHRHKGEERYLVIQGACREDDGTISEPGEVILRPAGSVHSFEVISDVDLIFAIEHRGLEFENLD